MSVAKRAPTWGPEWELPGARGDKVRPLGDAVAELVRPGMLIHLCYTHTPPFAAIYEIARRFRGKSPRFRIAVSAAGIWAQIPIAAGLAEELACAYGGDGFPRPAPSKVIQRFHRGGGKIECWTTLTMRQRLVGGALGVGWVPTNSLQGSTMAIENRESFLVVDMGGEKEGFVKSLRPDLTIRHAWCADRAGNAVLTPPNGEGLWPHFASKTTLLTVERVVSTDAIRRSPYERLPAHLVGSVSVAPLGGHPGPLIAGGDSYAEDLEFYEAFRNAAREPGSLERWMEKWVYNSDPGQYAKGLGKARVARLRKGAALDAWRSAPRPRAGGACTDNEMMVCVAARRIAGAVRRKGHKVVLAGIGASNLAGWLAAPHMEAELVAENGYYGYSPRPGLPYVFNLSNAYTCLAVTDTIAVLGCSLRHGLAALGGAQVDARGNINSTRAGGEYLLGSGGSNDAASTAAEIIAVAPQGKERLVPEVEYVTAPGERVTALVTTGAVFQKADGVLHLASRFPRWSVERLRESTGWKFEVKGDAVEPPPAKAELARLRSFDPGGLFR